MPTSISLSLFLLITSTGPPAALAQTFVLDATRSSITLSGTVAGGQITAQGPGSLTSALVGTLQVTVAGNTIQFTGASLIQAQTNSSWQPLADGSAGSGPANYGAQASLGFASGLAALRTVQLEANSPALNLSSGQFDSSSLSFSFPANSLSTFAYNVAGLAHGAKVLSGYATNAVTSQGTLATAGKVQTLTLPVDATFSLKLLSAGDTTLRLQGQLVGSYTQQSTLQPVAAGPWTAEPPTLSGVTMGGNGMAAIAVDGRTFFSPGGSTTWSAGSSANTNALNGISYGLGSYVAVGQGGTILQSSDGTSWTPRSSGTTNTLYAIDFANSLFVAVGAKGTITTSPDGAQWTPATTGLPSFADLMAVKFGAGVFAAAGTAYTTTSADGINWMPRFSSLGAPVTALAYGGGTFVAYVGYNMGTSPDGVTWTGQTKAPFSNIRMYGLAYADNAFVLVGDSGSIYTSPDGIAWTAQPTNNPANLRAVGAFGNSLYAVGEQGTVLTSTTATNWLTLNGTAAPPEQLNGVAAGNGSFVAVGEVANGQGVIETSPDGNIWTPQSSGTSNRLSRVTYAKDRFLAVGYQYTGVIVSSPDAGHWSRLDLPAGQSPAMATYGNQTFVVVGSDYLNPNTGMALTSSDGANWTTHSTGPAGLNAVSFINNTFMAAGTGVILTSPDGSQWTQQFENTTYQLTGIAYGNGIYVAVGYDPLLTAKAGIVVTSSDGVNWTAGPSGIYDRLDDVQFVQGSFYVAGQLSGQIAWAAILASTNGLAWSYQPVPAGARPIHAIASDMQRMVAVGSYGTILSSALAQPGTAPTQNYQNAGWAANGTFGFDITGPAATSAIVLVSTNYSRWDPIFTNTPFNGSVSFNDPASHKNPPEKLRVYWIKFQR